MNKRELIAMVAETVGMSQAKTAEVINALFDAETGVVAAEVTRGSKVTIPGFGTFGKRTRAARVGTNPANGTRISISAKEYVYFKVGKTLRERITTEAAG